MLAKSATLKMKTACVPMSNVYFISFWQLFWCSRRERQLGPEKATYFKGGEHKGVTPVFEYFIETV